MSDVSSYFQQYIFHNCRQCSGYLFLMAFSFFLSKQLRKLLLEILHRIPTNEHLRPHFQVSASCNVNCEGKVHCRHIQTYSHNLNIFIQCKTRVANEQVIARRPQETMELTNVRKEVTSENTVNTKQCCLCAAWTNQNSFNKT